MLILHFCGRGYGNETHKVYIPAVCEYLASCFNTDLKVEFYPSKITKLLLNSGYIVDRIEKRNLLILENIETNKLIFFSTGDRIWFDKNVQKIFEERPDLVCCVFKTQYSGLSGYYNTIKTFPFIFLPRYLTAYEDYRSFHRILSFKEKSSTIFFAGRGTSPIRTRFFKKQNELGSNWKTQSGGLKYPEYCWELQKSKYCLSLPGRGFNCYREIECFGLGSVVIAPEFQNVHSNPLIPDYHYLAFPYLEKMSFEYIRGESMKLFEGTSEDKYNLIQKNALQWYEKTIVMPQGIKTVIKKEYLDYLSCHFMQ